MPVTIATTNSRLTAAKVKTDLDNCIDQCTKWAMIAAFKVGSDFSGASAHVVSESAGGGGNDGKYSALRLRDGHIWIALREYDIATVLLDGGAYTKNQWQLGMVYRDGSTVGVRLNGGAAVTSTFTPGTPINVASFIYQHIGALQDGDTYIMNLVGQVAYAGGYRNYIPSDTEWSKLWAGGKLDMKCLIDGRVTRPAFLCLLNDDTPYVGGDWTLASTGNTGFSDNKDDVPGATDPHYVNHNVITRVPGCVAFWPMQEPTGDFVDVVNGLVAAEYGGSIARRGRGKFGPYCAHFANSDVHLRCSSKLLDIVGKCARVTYLVWAHRYYKSGAECFCGEWDEYNPDPEGRRQTAMFGQLGAVLGLNPPRVVVCHVSDTGWATPGKEWCEEYSAGATAMTMNTSWQFMAVTFNRVARSYLNAALDVGPRNPYVPPGAGVADKDPVGGFKIGCTYYGGVPANKLYSDVAGVAVFNRDLRRDELAAIRNETSFINTGLHIPLRGALWAPKMYLGRAA